MRPSILSYIDRITALGKSLSDAISLSLGLDQRYMRQNFLAPEPVAIVRCFKYHPATAEDGKPVWGIGEHSGYFLFRS
jgi:isopenicillin N synthase-like dioxygenase